MRPLRLRSIRAGWVAWAALVVMLLVGASRPAHASPSAKLTYVRGAGAEKCPDEQALRQAVAARLGFDVFFPWARRTVVAEIERGPRGFKARLQILGEDGVVLGVRSIDATSESCNQVAQALALAISIAADDFGLDEVPPPEPSPPREASPPPDVVTRTEPVAPPPEAAPAAPAPSQRSPRIEASLTLEPVVSFLVAPATAVGFQGDFDVRLSRLFSLGLDFRGDLPASSNDVQTYVLVGSVVPCMRVPKPLLLCAAVALGDFHESGVNVTHSQHADALFATVGPRVGVEIPLSRRFFLAAHAEGAFVLVRHSVTLGGGPAFTLPVLVPSLGAGGGVLF